MEGMGLDNSFRTNHHYIHICIPPLLVYTYHEVRIHHMTLFTHSQDDIYSMIEGLFKLRRRVTIEIYLTYFGA